PEETMNLLCSSSRPYVFTARVIVLLLVLSFAPVALAQQPPPNDEVKEMIEQLRKQVAELEARTKELEARLNKEATPAPTPEAIADKPVQAEQEMAKEESQTASAMNHAGHGGGLIGTPLMQIRGFSDVNFRASNVKGQTNTFALGQLALFINSRLSDKMN